MEKVIEMILDGMTAKEIAYKTGRSISGVYLIAKKNGLEFKRHKSFRESDKRIIEYRKQGMGYRKISRMTGMDAANVRKRCIILGLSGKEFAEAPKQNTTNDVAQVCKMHGVSYLGGYKNNRSNIEVECLTCGNKWFINYTSLLQSGIKCKECKRRDTEEKEKRKRQEKEQKQKEKKLNRKVSCLMLRNVTQLNFKFCPECGNAFMGRRKYCSDQCHKRAKGRTKEYIRRNKIKALPHDADITLLEVYQRDKGICYLCGKYCDWDDFEEKDGRFIAGRMYPSIDHVKPIAKGGSHTWENVRLAHRYCNSKKRDRIVPPDPGHLDAPSGLWAG